MRTPLLLLGDGPFEPTGLGRIAQDLGQLLQVHFADQVDLLHVGGPTGVVWKDWAHVPLTETDRADDWGARYVQQVYRSAFGDRPGILWAVWDPSRLYPYLRIDLPVDRWAYVAIDGDAIQGTIGGPAAEAIRGFDRVVAYGRWGKGVLTPIRSDVAWLPHGLRAGAWAEADPEDRAAVSAWIGPAWKPAHQRLIGCVATNQPRKDLGLFCWTLRTLLDRGHPVFGWLHTDQLVKAWSVPQLAEDFGLGRHLRISGITEPVSDDQLGAAYRTCSVTIAPGLAEGFGYPIVESLAAGTPVVHVDHGGGRELVPTQAWRFPVREIRLDGVYGLRRPVCRAEDVANAIERIWQWEAAVGETVVREYCRGAVAHLAWPSVQGRWQTWIRQGLEGR